MLTASIEDTAGTAGKDTFKGIINDDGADNLSTIQTGDLIDGGAGVDKLEITVIEDMGTTPIIELANVEQVYIRDIGISNAIDASLWTDVQQIWSNRSSESTSVENISSAVTIGMAETESDFTVTYEDDALDSDEATQAFALTNVGSDNTRPILELIVGGDDVVTTVSFAVTGENFVEFEDDDESETLIVTGTGSLDIFTDAEFGGVTTADFSKNSGGVTVTLAHEDMVVTGGSGDDVISLNNGTALTEEASISLGAGNDSLLDNGSDGVGTDAVLDGGAGTDTIASTLLTVGNRANFKGWEVLDIANDDRTINASLFTASTFRSLALSDETADVVTVSGLAGTSIVLDIEGDADIVQADRITATLATATGTSDSGVINFNNDGDAEIADFRTAGLETITINSGGQNSTDVNEVGTIGTTDNVLTTINITGDNDFTLGGVRMNITAESTAVTTVLGTAVAGALTLIDGSKATGNLDITAGASLTTSNLTMTYNSLTIKTGSGDDTVSIGGRGTVETGKGADDINVAVAGVSVNVGVDKDVDAVNVALAARFTSTDGDFTSSSRFTSISNLAKNDVIDLTLIEATLNDITDFTADAENYGSLEAAINGAIDDGDTDLLFFNWVDGNTYIVSDGSVSANSDAVVRLIGTYEDFTVANGVITIA